MIGTRGVPANYGGFETCVEELGKRLVDKEHSVTVYCRKELYNDRPLQYLGMDLIYLPSLRLKAFETLSHTTLSMFHAIAQSYDVFMVFNAANSPTLLIPRILGKKIAINTDGLEWKRVKWGKVGRRYYKIAEWLSTKLADRLVSDSRGIQNYYRNSYGVESTYIAYGAYITSSQKPQLLEKFGLKPNEYFLQITRFEPENNPLLTIQAFRKLQTDKKLVIIGGVPYLSPYAKQIMASSDKDIVLPGFIYDKEMINELWCNCFAYIHGNEVGGTNPALLQSMASSAFTIAIDVDFNRDVLGEGGIFFEKDSDSLAGKIKWALDNSVLLDDYRKRAVNRIRSYYSWDQVAEQYESLFAEICKGSK